jgi:AcrR family transcriptional regulator
MPKQLRTELGTLRREQIVEAAVAIIAEQGLQHLSLSEIEKRAGMCRGQLTYYFPAKEEILLAVFDRLLQMLHRRAHGEGGTGCMAEGEQGWERLRHFLTLLLLQPPEAAEFHSLQYTFLSQIGHRADFRRRLAGLYEEWRSGIARDIEAEFARRRGVARVSARTVATLVQAILHGLAIQRNADPDCYDRQEMLELCLDLLGSYLRPQAGDNGSPRRGAKNKPAAVNGAARAAARRSSTSPRVNHE